MNTSTTQLAVQNNKRTQKAIAKVKAKAMALTERGMATAEYAVGILAAVALALVLIKVFNADSFLTIIVKLISEIFSKILGWLP